MANAADYLTFSTQQVLTEYKLRTRSVASQEVTVTNISNAFRITVLIEDTFDGSNISPNQLILEPKQSKTFKITYDLAVMEALPVGVIPATINFVATGQPIFFPPPPPPPPLPLPPPPLPVIIYGCTQPSSINYNKAATVDDGTCIPKIFGCMNRNAINYNPVANIEDNTCQFPIIDPPPRPSGCTNRTALNYNPIAVIDDGSCILQIVGCLDETALNYNPGANTAGECLYRPPVQGCMDANANNYNPLATVAKNELCEYTPVGDPPPVDIIGCMDPNMQNYNPRATKPAIPDICQPYPILGCTSSGACNYNPNATQDDGSCFFKTPCVDVRGCTNESALNYNPNANVDDGSCQFVLPPDDVIGCDDQTALNYNPNVTVAKNDECQYIKYGCTNPTAANYDGNAQQDNGTCVFIGCKDPSARNYDPSPDVVACPNNICCDTVYCECAYFECQSIGEIVSQGAANAQGFANVCRSVQGYGGGGNGCPQCPQGCDTVCNEEYVGVIEAKVIGCTDPGATNYNPLANVDDGLCTYRTGCTSNTAKNYNPLAIVDDGSCIEPIYGCSSPTAKNYNPDADRDDGSCQEPIYGCTDFVALNYNAAATDDNGSCEYYTSGGGSNMGGTGQGNTGGGGGGRMDVQDTLLTGTVGGGTVEPGGVVTQNQA